MKSLESIIKIADIHAKRLRYAIKHLKDKMPLSAQDVEAISDDDLPIFELYASRFSKLQDFMGTSLFPALLESTGEQIEEMTFIDRLNKLEKLNLVPNAADWMSMRQTRNSLAHEYPEHPELTAKFFNEAFQRGLPLLEIFANIKKFIAKNE